MESEFPLYINTITTKFLTVVLKELRLQHIHYCIQVRDELLCSKVPQFQKKKNEIGISFYMLILNNVFKMPIKNPCCCLRGDRLKNCSLILSIYGRLFYVSYGQNSKKN